MLRGSRHFLRADSPNGEFDDLADAGVWGLMRIRQGNLIRLASEEAEEEWKPRAPAGVLLSASAIG